MGYLKILKFYFFLLNKKKPLILCVKENNLELFDKIKSKLIGKVTYDNKLNTECPEDEYLSSKNDNLFKEGLGEANPIIDIIQNIEKLSESRKEIKSSEIYEEIPNI